MEVDFAFLADSADAINGKIYVMGGAFDTIWAASMPLVYPQFAIALRVRFDSIESGEHKVNVNFVDMDGKHILPSANGVIKVSLPQGQRSFSANSILNIQMLKIEKHGEFSIDLTIDGKHEASLPLFIVQPKR